MKLDGKQYIYFLTTAQWPTFGPYEDPNHEDMGAFKTRNSAKQFAAYNARVSLSWDETKDEEIPTVNDLGNEIDTNGFPVAVSDVDVARGVVRYTICRWELKGEMTE